MARILITMPLALMLVVSSAKAEQSFHLPSPVPAELITAPTTPKASCDKLMVKIQGFFKRLAARKTLPLDPQVEQTRRAAQKQKEIELYRNYISARFELFIQASRDARSLMILPRISQSVKNGEWKISFSENPVTNRKRAVKQADEAAQTFMNWIRFEDPKIEELNTYFLENPRAFQIFNKWATELSEMSPSDEWKIAWKKYRNRRSMIIENYADIFKPLLILLLGKPKTDSEKEEVDFTIYKTLGNILDRYRPEDGRSFFTPAFIMTSRAVVINLKSARNSLKMGKDELSDYISILKAADTARQKYGVKNPTDEEIAEFAQLDVSRIAELRSFAENHRTISKTNADGEVMSLDEFVADMKEPEAEATVKSNNNIETLMKAMGSLLDERQLDVLSRHYGLNGYKKTETYEQIGQVYGVSKQAIEQWTKAALKILRAPFNEQSFEDDEEVVGHETIDEVISNAMNYMDSKRYLRQLLIRHDWRIVEKHYGRMQRTAAEIAEDLGENPYDIKRKLTAIEGILNEQVFRIRAETDIARRKLEEERIQRQMMGIHF